MPENPRWFSPPLYGLKTYGDLFTPRQLVALTTFSDLVLEARERVKRDAINAGLSDDDKPPHDGGVGAAAYGDALAVYLSSSLASSQTKGRPYAHGMQVRHQIEPHLVDLPAWRQCG